MLYLLTAIELSPSGRSTVHIYTQTIHRKIQNKQLFAGSISAYINLQREFTYFYSCRKLCKCV